jgi:hypothetical protein
VIIHSTIRTLGHCWKGLTSCFSLADCLNRILRLKEWLGLFKEGHDPTPVPVDEVSLRRNHVSQIHAMTNNIHESQSSGHVFGWESRTHCVMRVSTRLAVLSTGMPPTS